VLHRHCPHPSDQHHGESDQGQHCRRRHGHHSDDRLACSCCEINQIQSCSSGCALEFSSECIHAHTYVYIHVRC
jgi:hypothetical protein